MKEIEIHFKGGDGKRIKTLPEVPDNNDYVDLLTPQNIDGKKNFIQTPTINGKDIATQETLNEVSNSKQNTLTAGNGISIENDTISVTDAGGLTVLKESDFPLSADLLAKVNANPQNYCILYNAKYCYYVGRTTYLNYKVLLYVSIPNQDSVGAYTLGMYDWVYMDINDGRIMKGASGYSLAKLGQETFILSNAGSRTYQIKAVQDTTDNSVKTGTQIRKAITIRKWH